MKRYICECGEKMFLPEGFKQHECINCGRIIKESAEKSSLNEDLNLNKVAKTLKDKIRSTCNANLGDSTSGLKIEVLPGADGIIVTITSKRMRIGILKAIRDAINNYYFGEGSDQSAVQNAKVFCHCGEEEKPFLERATYAEFNEALKVQDSNSIIEAPKIEMLLKDPNKLNEERNQSKQENTQTAQEDTQAVAQENTQQPAPSVQSNTQAAQDNTQQQSQPQPENNTENVQNGSEQPLSSQTTVTESLTKVDEAYEIMDVENVPVDIDTPIEWRAPTKQDVNKESDDRDCVQLSARNVMDAYQTANKWLDSVKEIVYTRMNCPFFSSYIHNIAHKCPGEFDKFGDILHTSNIEIPYPATAEIDYRPRRISEVFDMIFRCLDKIKNALNDFIKCTDNDYHGMSCSAETLLNNVESEYPMLYRLKAKWEQCDGGLVEFDKYVMQYVEHKDDLLESANTSKKSMDEGLNDFTFAPTRLIINVRGNKILGVGEDGHDTQNLGPVHRLDEAKMMYDSQTDKRTEYAYHIDENGLKQGAFDITNSQPKDAQSICKDFYKNKYTSQPISNKQWVERSNDRNAFTVKLEDGTSIEVVLKRKWSTDNNSAAFVYIRVDHNDGNVELKEFYDTLDI